MIPAMILFSILSVLVALLVLATLRLVSHDGRGPQRPPASHFEDPRFRSPLAG